MEYILLAPFVFMVMLTKSYCQDSFHHELSGSCLDCLKSVSYYMLAREDKQAGCYRMNGRNSALFCGSYGISERVYSQCSGLIQLSSEFSSWRQCSASDDCSRRCIQAYHSYHSMRCLLSANVSLTCAQFTMIHFHNSAECVESRQTISLPYTLPVSCKCNYLLRRNGSCYGGYNGRSSDYGRTSGLTSYVIVVLCIAAVALLLIVVAALYRVRMKDTNFNRHNALDEERAHEGDPRVYDESSIDNKHFLKLSIKRKLKRTGPVTNNHCMEVHLHARSDNSNRDQDVADSEAVNLRNLRKEKCLLKAAKDDPYMNQAVINFRSSVKRTEDEILLRDALHTQVPVTTEGDSELSDIPITNAPTPYVNSQVGGPLSHSNAAAPKTMYMHHNAPMPAPRQS